VKGGIAIINADENFAPMWRVLAGTHPIIEFALDKPVQISAKVQQSDFKQIIEFKTSLGHFSATLNVPGLHNARNALAATAAAVALKVAPTKIAAGLEKFAGVAGRLQRLNALQNAVVIDDSYNANPMSLVAAIEVLVQATGKKILVLGDMGELGIEASKMHAEMGQEAKRLGVNQLFAIGELSSYAVKEFGSGAQHFQNIETLLGALKKEMGKGCTILVKGSRFMKMERVVKELISDKQVVAELH
jgi:UDP-N-acetylmuramoyl-tripeptide--D-alanyl-D-alanine ligase